MKLPRLLRLEGRKWLRRPLFVSTVAGYAGLVYLLVQRAYAVRARTSSGTFALPEVWGLVLGDLGSLTLGVSSGLLLLLTSAEYDWGTARRLLLDGQSKLEFALSKLILVAPVAALFLAILLSITGGFGALGARETGPQPLIRPEDIRLVGGMLVALVGYGVGAVAVGLTVRRSAPGLGLWLVYAFVLEPFASSLVSAGNPRASATLPLDVFQRLALPQTHALGTPLGGLLTLAGVYIVGAAVASLWLTSWRDA